MNPNAKYLKRYKNKEKRVSYILKYQKEYMRKHRIELKMKGKTSDPNSTTRVREYRKKAMQKIGKLECNQCGCNVYNLLEINHINGGGGKAMKGKSTKYLYLAILSGRIDIKTLDIKCKVCNIQHYVEKILGIKGHKIIWVH